MAFEVRVSACSICRTWLNEAPEPSSAKELDERLLYVFNGMGYVAPSARRVPRSVVFVKSRLAGHPHFAVLLSGYRVVAIRPLPKEAHAVETCATQAVTVQVYVQDAEDGEGAPRSVVTPPSLDEGVIVVMSSAITYVMSPGPASIFKQPSPVYLTAVHYTLSQSFPNLRGVPIEVCDCTCEC